MLVGLPLAGYLLLLCIFRARGAGWRDGALHAATAWGVAVVLFTEALSLPGWLTRPGLSVAWLALDLAALTYLTYTARKRMQENASSWLRSVFRPPESRLSEAEVALLTGAGIIIALVGVVALLSPPNTWDAMQYHMPRIVHWLQNRTVAFYPTHEARQLYMAPGAEFVMLQLHALSAGDRLDNLVQWFALVGSALGVSMIARSLGAGSRGQVLSAIICITIPQGILQASGAKNDYVLSFWLVLLAHYALGFKRAPTLGGVLGIGAALGLAFVTKATAYILAPALLVACVLAWPWPVKMILLKRLPLVVLLVAGLNVGHVSRNYALFGSPFGSFTAHSTGGFRYTNDEISLSAVVSNVVRNAALHLGTPVPDANAAIARRMERIIRTFGGDPNDPKTTWSYTRFEIPGLSYHESLAGNPLHLALIGMTLLTLGVSRKQGDQRDVLIYSGALTMAFLVFCAVLRWQPWHTRLHLPLFVLWSAATGAVVARHWSPAAANGLGLVLLLLSVPPAVGNELRPRALGGELNVLNQDRTRLYFADRRDAREPYMAAADVARRERCRNVGLDFSMVVGDQYEYPLMVLLGAEKGDKNVRHVGVTNASAKYGRAEDGDGVAPCAVICGRCAKSGEKWAAYAGNEARTAVFGDVAVIASTGGLKSDPAHQPSVRVTLSTGRVRPGERLTIGLEARNPQANPAADLYVGILLPGNRSAVFVAGSGGLSAVIGVDSPADFPLAKPAPPGLALSAGSFYELRVPERGFGPGRYQVFAALVRQGAFSENRYDPADVLAFDTRELTVLR